MQTRLLSLMSALALIAVAGSGAAEQRPSSETQPPAKQSAPSESSHAPGHDAQSGKPETGELEKGQAQTDSAKGVRPKNPDAGTTTGATPNR